MVTLDEFSRVVSEIYASSLDAANWTVALAEIAGVLDGTVGGLILGGGRSRSVMASTMPQDAAAAYQAYYHAIDFVVDACETGPVGLIRGGRELVGHRKRSEFYADWQCRFDLTDGLFVRLSTGPTPATLVVAAPPRDAQFETSERVQFVSGLLSHLQQAIRTQRHLAELGKAAGELTDIIGAIRRGMVIVGTCREVVHVNSAAERILKAGDGLFIRCRTIQAASTTANGQLQRIINNALVESRYGARTGDSIACSRPSGKRPYIIHVTPLATTPADPSAARALVTIVDPEQETEPPKILIKRLFGLTNAEAEVALRVMRGDGLVPISADLGLSRATVNTHLQHVFDKTDTHRQAELVRLLLSIVP